MESISYLGEQRWREGQRLPRRSTPKPTPVRAKDGKYKRDYFAIYAQISSTAVIATLATVLYMHGSVYVQYTNARASAATLPISLSSVAASLPVVIKPRITKEEIEAKKDALVNAISACESNNLPPREASALNIFDSNNVPSLGSMQFQVKTIQYYVQLFEHRAIDKLDAEMLAHDFAASHALAYRIIFEDKGKGWGNWYNCGMRKNIQAEQKVKEINNLELQYAKQN